MKREGSRRYGSNIEEGGKGALKRSRNGASRRESKKRSKRERGIKRRKGGGSNWRE